jgi:acetylornithine/N-succinyldiaminopimelate aminotransferase
MADPTLEGERLAADPRVLQAKKLLLEAVQDHQKNLSLRPSDPALKLSYETLLAEFAERRGGKLWFPYIGSGIGHGTLVELCDGSVKYDFICGIGTHYLGHSHPALIEASVEASISDTVMQGHLQQNGDTIELSHLLADISGMDHVFLASSGVMANENALKIAFQKNHPARRVLAFDRCFVGRTLVASQITDKPSFREGLPTTIPVDYIPFYDANRPEESTRQALATLKTYLARYPHEYAAMIFELVQGEAGFYPGSTAFFRALMTFLKEHRVAIIVDEVQTFGRLPELFASYYFGLDDLVDIITIGKLSQVCAVLFKESFRPRPGLLSQTFTGSTSAIRAAKAIIQELLHGGYLGSKGKIAQIYTYFHSKLEELSNRHPHLIQGPFGIGCMVAFTPLDGSLQQVMAFVHALFEAGVISFIAGSHPTRVRFLVPAGAVSFADIDEVTRLVEQTLLSCQRI